MCISRDGEKQGARKARQHNTERRADRGLMNAYDWSSPAKGATLATASTAPSSSASVTPAASSSQLSSSQRSRCQLPVPIPVHCEPLTTTDSTMKVSV